MTTPTVRTRVTEYAVCALPEDNINAYAYTIRVSHRGDERWAVTHHGYCLGTDGEWAWESLPSHRGDEWQASHRFDLENALRLATEQAPLIDINGLTAADVLAAAARREEQR